MATRETILYVCDLPHEEGLVEAALTGVEVRHGRRRVTVDLCQDHATTVLAVLEHGTRPTTALRAGGDHRPTPRAVRAWARSNGVQIASRGRVPKELVAAYVAARAAG